MTARSRTSRAPPPVPAQTAPASGTSSPGEVTRHPWAHVVAIALAAVATYANSLRVPFVFDDETSILLNRSIASWAEGPPTRRLAYLTFTLNHAIGGFDPFGYHVFNVCVHALAGVAVYALVRTLLRATREGAEGGGVVAAGAPAGWVALAAALLFVVHPVQTQAVTYVVQRIASLATLFYVGSLALYAWARVDGSARPTSRWVAWGAAIVAAAVAMFVKETTFTLPLAIVLLELGFFRGTRWKRVARVLPFLLLLPVIPLQILGAERPVAEVMADAVDAARGDSTLPRTEYLATQARVVLTYVRLAVLPVRQNLDYDFPIERSFTSPAVLLSAAALAAIAALGGWLLWRGKRPGARPAGAGVLLFFLGLSVESAVPIADVINEHRMYLPMVGFALFVAGALSSAAALLPAARTALAASFGAWVLVLGAATIARNDVWRDPATLWADAAAKSPRKPRPHYNLANTYLARGDLAAAEREWEEVVRLEPLHSWALNQLGTAAFTRGELASAEAYYRRAAAVMPVNPEAFYNLAMLLEAMGRGAEAVPLYRRFYDMQPLGRERELDVLRRRFAWQ